MTRMHRIAASPWHKALPPFVLLLVATLLLYWNTAAGMVAIWSRSDTFTHGFIVPPIALWLAWRQRDRLAAIVPKPAPWILLPMAGAGLLWLLGELVGVNAATQFALVAMLVLMVPAVLGIEVARALLFPLSFMFFSVPVGEFMFPVLMQWTADFTVAAVRLSGVPVYREGLKFVIPSGSWSVVEACSGVRYLIASCMVGSLFAYLNYRSAKRRWIFMGLSILVPIVANWVRAYMIVMLGHLSDNRIATGVDHLVYGWVFFGIVFMALFMIGARWSEPDPVAAPRLPAATLGGQGGFGQLGWLSVVCVAVLVVSPVAAMRSLDVPPADNGALRLVLPDAAAGGWQPSGVVYRFSPDFQNPTAKLSQGYANAAGQTLGLHLFYYRQQDAERKLVSSTNALVRADDKYWNAVSSSSRVIAEEGVAGRTAVVETTLLGPDGQGLATRERLVAWQVYWINGTWIAGDAQAKLKAAWDRLRRRGDDSAALVLVAAETQPGQGAQALATFWRANRGMLEAGLVAARDGAIAP